MDPRQEITVKCSIARLIHTCNVQE